MIFLQLFISFFVSTLLALLFSKFCGITFGTSEMGVLVGSFWFLGAFVTLFARYGRF